MSFSTSLDLPTSEAKKKALKYAEQLQTLLETNRKPKVKMEFCCGSFYEPVFYTVSVPAISFLPFPRRTVLSVREDGHTVFYDKEIENKFRELLKKNQPAGGSA